MPRHRSIGPKSYLQLIDPLALSRGQLFLEVVEHGFVCHLGLAIGLRVSGGWVNIFYILLQEKVLKMLLMNYGLLSENMAWGTRNWHMMFRWTN